MDKDYLEAVVRQFAAVEPVVRGECLYCDGYRSHGGGFIHDGADEGTCPWVAARRYFEFVGTDGLVGANG